MTISRVLQAGILRTAFALPARLRRTIIGAPVVVDGATLDPDTQLLLRLRELAGEKGIEELPLTAGRRALTAGSALVGGRQPIGSVRDLSIPGPAGDVRVRHYLPTLGAAPAPTLVFFHGGAFVYGDLDSHDALCRFLAMQAGVRVLAVDYRLAPEHPFPAAVEDCFAAYAWVTRHADELGADVERLAVGGDSAGANLAAVTARLARDGDVVTPLFSWLVYPVTDFTTRRRSRDLFNAGFFLTERFIQRAEDHYVPTAADKADPRASPLLEPDLAGLPETYIVTAGFDPLRDEGAAYADALREAGVDVTYVCESGLIHSFANSLGVGTSARLAMDRATAVLRDGLTRSGY